MREVWSGHWPPDSVTTVERESFQLLATQKINRLCQYLIVPWQKKKYLVFGSSVVQIYFDLLFFCTGAMQYSARKSAQLILGRTTFRRKEINLGTSGKKN